MNLAEKYPNVEWNESGARWIHSGKLPCWEIRGTEVVIECVRADKFKIVGNSVQDDPLVASWGIPPQENIEVLFTVLRLHGSTI